MLFNCSTKQLKWHVIRISSLAKHFRSVAYNSSQQNAQALCSPHNNNTGDDDEIQKVPSYRSRYTHLPFISWCPLSRTFVLYVFERALHTLWTTFTVRQFIRNGGWNPILRSEKKNKEPGAMSGEKRIKGKSWIVLLCFAYCCSNLIDYRVIVIAVAFLQTSKQWTIDCELKFYTELIVSYNCLSFNSYIVYLFCTFITDAESFFYLPTSLLLNFKKPLSIFTVQFSKN